jgi:hypothetical protein
MIALQARSPQLPDPAAQTAKFVNMMNMTKQQEAAERQAMQAQQAMEFARTGEARAVETQTATMRDKDLDFQLKDMKRLRNIGVAVLESGNEEAYQDLVGMIEQSDPQFGATIRKVAPTFNAKVLQTILMEADKYIDKSVATPVASLELGVDGTPRSVQVGGLSGTAFQSPVYDAPETPMAAPRATPTAPTNPMARGAPAPNAAGEAPGSLGLVVASALQTGVMSKADYDKMLANVQPASRPKITNWVRENNISVADAPPLVDNQMRDTPMSYDGQTPESQFAVYRGQPMQAQTAGLAGAPEMQQTLAQTQPRTITRLQQRNPNQPIAPGSSVVPLPRLGAEKRVEAQAAKDVELAMAPQIATATKSAERAIELKSTAKKAKFDTEAVIDEVADRINTIDQLLRNPNRFSIIGPIEGNLPRLLQTGARADAQAAFDKIKNTATLTSLIDMRRSTETGASPVGANPTDRDAKIVEQAASKLIQTGETAAFDAELMDMRRKLYRTYVNAQREYDGVYGDVLKENPNLRLAVPKVSDRYLSTKDLPKQKTPVKTPTSTLSPQTRKKYGL